jgi:hypothetical protein
MDALSGIRAHDPSVRASEDSSCLRPGGYCDRLRPCTVQHNCDSKLNKSAYVEKYKYDH